MRSLNPHFYDWPRLKFLKPGTLFVTHGLPYLQVVARVIKNEGAFDCRKVKQSGGVLSTSNKHELVRYPGERMCVPCGWVNRKTKKINYQCTLLNSFFVPDENEINVNGLEKLARVFRYERPHIIAYIPESIKWEDRSTFPSYENGLPVDGVKLGYVEIRSKGSNFYYHFKASDDLVNSSIYPDPWNQCKPESIPDKRVFFLKTKNPIFHEGD